MCGIAGFVDRNHPGGRIRSAEVNDGSRDLIGGMCAAIRHRGPDDEGIHMEPGLGLGMRRLSIIDLASGQQPIHNEDGTVWIVFKGEMGENLWRFTRDVMAYALRVEAYALLIHDQFPSFALSADAQGAVLAGQS